MNWFKRLVTLVTEDTEALKARLEADKPDNMVNAPVLGFVKTVKANPRRFRCRRVFPSKEEIKQYTWMTRESTQFYKITDKLLGHHFVATYHQGRLYSVHGTNITLNGWETKYLHEQLSPVFIAAVNRKHQRAQRQADKVRQALQAAELDRRQAWTSIYGK